MLGIVPDVHQFFLPQQRNTVAISSDEEGSNDNRHGFIRRLKSFRKSTVRRAQGRERPISSTGLNSSSLKEKLPAKYIQTTDVKKSTLNPIWMEKFRL